MSKPVRCAGCLVLVGLSLLACSFSCRADNPAEAREADETDEDFGLTRIWQIHLHVTAENWKSMQPTRGGFPGFGSPQPGGAALGNPALPPAGGATTNRLVGRQPDSPSAAAPPPLAPPGAAANGTGPAGPGPGFRPGSFGYEFDYVKADVELDGRQLENVGLRFKGNGSYMLSSAGRKRPFKIDFNRFVEDQRFHGMQQLNLHNNVMDPTHVRQALSYPVFQAAGIPSPRTAFAEVSLTIDGECEREVLGLYTIVEEVDKAFLKRHFKTTKGMLLKPAGTQGLEYKGEDWTAYDWYEPKSKPKKSEARRLIDALRLIHQADDDQFRREIGTFLDTDEFARFLAANTLLANMDSFLTHVHNYYVYLNPTSNRFMVLPWDLDLSMGAFFMAGSAEQLQELSISHPHVGENKLLDRLLAWDEFNRVYRNHLRQLTGSCFGEQGQTTRDLPIVQAALKDLIARDAKQAAAAQAARGPGGFGPGPGAGGMFGSAVPLDVFLAKRRESILAQLAGMSKGRSPGMGFGPGGPRGGGPGGGFGPGNFHGAQILRVADEDKDQKLSRPEFLDLGDKWLKKWDQDQSGSLSIEEITAGLNDALGPPPNAPGGFKPPAGFGPGMFLGPPLLKAADADKSGQASREEWTNLFAAWFKDWNTNGDESLDNAELVAGLNKTFAPPAGFGPPGAGPISPRPATEAK